METVPAASPASPAGIWASRAGTALAALAIAHVALRFWRRGDPLAPADMPAVVWLCTAGLSLAYAAANTLPALAWRTLLEMQGTHADRAWSLRTYGVSQLARYLPGNVLHFVSRQLLGASAGVPQAVLARSALYEIASLAAAGLLLSLLALPLVANVSGRTATPVGAAAILAALAVVLTKAGPGLARVLAAHMVFLLVASLVFTTLLVLVAPGVDRDLRWTTVCGAYAAAWLAGFLAPGAPAGLGVRELALVFLLDGRTSEPDLLAAVVLSRAVTLLGDTVFFGATIRVGRRAGPHRRTGTAPARTHSR